MIQENIKLLVALWLLINHNDNTLFYTSLGGQRGENQSITSIKQS